MEVVCADVLDWAKEYDGPQFHALLCDPPYELGFMGKDWDRSGIAFQPETWTVLAEHLLPGAFGMAFASARGWHRLAVAIEDAGLRIHPSIFAWVYGSGFPKATRIDTQVDRLLGVKRDIIAPPYVAPDNKERRGGRSELGYQSIVYRASGGSVRTLPKSKSARSWEGHRYGLQCIKPALEPIIVFQKPYEGKPVDSITRTGAGALYIEGARIGTERIVSVNSTFYAFRGLNPFPWHEGHEISRSEHTGRWPANFALVHHPGCRLETVADWECHPECPVRKLGEQSGERPGFRGFADFFHLSDWNLEVTERLAQSDPVRYVAKASRRERDAGLEGLLDQDISFSQHRANYKNTRSWVTQYPDGSPRPMNKPRNSHPTVKPIALARWLTTLLLPPPDYAPRRLLVPFAGVASEMIAASLAGWEEIVGVEINGEYCDIARARLAHWTGYIYERVTREKLTYEKEVVERIVPLQPRLF